MSQNALNQNTNLKGRVFNYSSLAVLVWVEHEDLPPPNKRSVSLRGLSDEDAGKLLDKQVRAWYRLAPGCETPPEFYPKFLMALPSDEGGKAPTIFGAEAWNIGGVVVHVVDDPRPRPSVAPKDAVPPFEAPKDALIRIVGLGEFKVASDVPTFVPDEVRDLTLVPQRPWVTVLGAGIAGLTAAHELIERGFQVQVVEKSHGSPADDTEDLGFDPLRFKRGLDEPDIGGIARTQWSTAPMARDGGLASLLKQSHSVVKDKKLSRTNSIHGDGDWYGNTVGRWNSLEDSRIPLALEFDGENQWNEARQKDAIKVWLEASEQLAPVAALQLVVVIYRSGNSKVAGPANAYSRLKTCIDFLTTGDGKGMLPDFVAAMPVARIEVNEEPGASFPGLLLRHHEQLGLIAGEHGFRFFPGFYRHLRDTMKRTPIYDPSDKRFTTRTVHDNLTEVSYQTIEDPIRRHGSSFLRKKFASFGALLNQYAQLRSDLGYRPADLLRFMLRMGRYMTSSTKRREKHYEKISWWDFLSIRHLGQLPSTSLTADSTLARLSYGERFMRALIHSPEALVAMKAKQADARTQGNISVQLAMDQLDLHEDTDSTLSGPTSESWFRHWREYLKQQGVKFFVGEVTEISYPSRACDEPDSIVPNGVQATIAWPNGARPSSFYAPTTRKAEAYQTHYYVCAMDAIAVSRVTAKLRDDYKQVKALESFVKLTSASRPELGNLPGAPRDPESLQVTQDAQLPYQTLTGLQLYYLPRVSFDAAHIYYADSAWGLSAVSQIQYWGPVGTGGQHSKLLGNLSIDIGSWRERAAQDPRYSGPRAEWNSQLAPAPDPSECTPDEIAAEVLKEINAGRKPTGPTPSYYHIDDYIQFSWRAPKDEPRGPMALRPTWNRSPFLINVVGGWKERPDGTPWSATSILPRSPHVPGDGIVTVSDPDEKQKQRQWVWRHREGGYEVYFSNLVFAGTHMRTFTRMGTMESANESARHAVNAILDHLTSRQDGFKVNPQPVEKKLTGGIREANIPERLATPFGDYCDTWDLEENEIADFDILKAIDKHLFETRKEHARSSDDVLESHDHDRIPPHLFDLLGLDRLPDLIDNDAEAKEVIDLLRVGLERLKSTRHDDLDAILANIESLKKLYSTFKPFKK